MSALHDARFRWLLAGQALSKFGDTALYLALGLWVKDLTGDNALASAIFFAVEIPVVLNPFAGYLVDRFRRRPTLILVNSITGLAVLALLVVHDRGQLLIIFGFLVVYGMSLNASSAAQNGLLKDMLSDADLASANAAMSLVTRLMMVGSPLAGAALYKTIGPHSLAVIDAASFFAAVIVLLLIKVDESQSVGRQPEPLAARLMAGFRHVHREPRLRRLTAGVGIALLASGFWEGSVFDLVEHGLGRSPQFVSVLLVLASAGGVCGAVLVARAIRRFGELRVVGLSLSAYALGTAMLVTGLLPFVLLGQVIEGFCIPWTIVGLTTAMQRFSTPRLQGRVGMLTSTVISAPLAVSIGLGTGLVDTVGFRSLLSVSAAVNAACAIVLLLRPLPKDAEIGHISQLLSEQEPDASTQGAA